MEIGEGSNGKRALEGGYVPPEKKQWKSPSQVQILEVAYTATPKPSAEMKEELAKLTGLDYKQVQYWFGNRRFLDRHGPRRYKTKGSDDEKYITYPGDWQSPENSKEGYLYLDSGRQCMNPQPLSAVAPVNMQPAMSSAFSTPQAAHGMKPWSHLSEMHEDIMPWQLQSIVTNIERKLGHSLIANGPILGVEFNSLPPGAFEAPLAHTSKSKASSRASNRKATGRVDNQPIKEAVFSPTSGANSVPCSSREGTQVVQSAHEFHQGVLPLGVPKYQCLPSERNLTENCDVGSPHLNLSSANTAVSSIPSERQDLCKYASATSTFTSQSQLTNGTIHPHKENHEMASSDLTDTQRTKNSLFSSSPPDLRCDFNPFPDLRNSQALSNMEVCDGSSVDIKLQMPSTISTCKDRTEDRDRSNQEVVDSSEGRNKLDSGIEQATTNCGTREGVNGVNNKEVDQAVQNQEIEDMLQRLSRLRGHGQFIVRPRERYQGRFGVAEKSEKRYFSDDGIGEEPIVVKWNEKEKRADYGVYISDSTLSDSSGSWETDSTHSDEYGYKVTSNLGDYVQSKLKIVDDDRQESGTLENEHMGGSPESEKMGIRAAV